MDIVVLDTETTGLDYRKGHRVIEIGCILLKNRRVTSEIFHCYINPQRQIDPEALKIHGITDQFLKDNLKDIKKNWPKKLPNGIIHGDLFIDNIFFKDNKLSGIIDFYFAANDYFMYELAICINALCLSLIHI